MGSSSLLALKVPQDGLQLWDAVAPGAEVQSLVENSKPLRLFRVHGDSFLQISADVSKKICIWEEGSVIPEVT